MGMALSPDNPLCFQQSRTPLEVQSETSCILIRDQLVKDLHTDLNARNISMTLYCAKLKETTEKKPLVTPLSASLAQELTYMTPLK